MGLVASRCCLTSGSLQVLKHFRYGLQSGTFLFQATYKFIYNCKPQQTSLNDTQTKLPSAAARSSSCVSDETQLSHSWMNSATSSVSYLGEREKKVGHLLRPKTVNGKDTCEWNEPSVTSGLHWGPAECWFFFSCKHLLIITNKTCKHNITVKLH